MVKCRDVTEMATDYMERALPLPARLSMRFHLLICSMCRAYLDQLHKTSRLLRGQSLPAPDEATVSRLIAGDVHKP